MYLGLKIKRRLAETASDYHRRLVKRILGHLKKGSPLASRDRDA